VTDPRTSLRRARPLLGTIVDIRAVGGQITAGAIDAAFAAVERVHCRMSAHDPESDVSRINRSNPGVCIEVDPWTHEVLRRARAVHDATEGLFDCAVGQVLSEAGFLPHMGDEGDEEGFGGLRDLELCADWFVRPRRRVRITLDGIAKGYAVDRAVEALRACGVDNGVVNAGGDLRVFGEAYESIHVRHPGAPGALLELGALREAAIASSAAYFSRKAPGGRDLSPIVDPRTLECCNPGGAVSVIAETCVLADALTKPLLIDPQRAGPLAKRLGATVVFIDANGTLQ
jgi:thiamine biosynthesis lipoprotein